MILYNDTYFGWLSWGLRLGFLEFSRVFVTIKPFMCHIGNLGPVFLVKLMSPVVTLSFKTYSCSKH